MAKLSTKGFVFTLLLTLSGLAGAQVIATATGPNKVYIEQIGSSNRITIDQLGGTNSVGGTAGTEIVDATSHTWC